MRKSLIAPLIIALPFILSCNSENNRPVVPDISTQASTSILQVTDTQEAASKEYDVKIYVENSASMYGYVYRNGTEFKASLHSLLSELKNSNDCHTLSFAYINNKIIDWNNTKASDEISDYITDLSQQDFIMRGGNPGSTDIANLFQLILNNQTDGEISILASDYIISPNHQDASDYLDSQKTKIKQYLIDKIKNKPDYAVVVYQLLSDFKGNYYNVLDLPQKIDSKKRPFYIIMMGESSKVKSLLEDVPPHKIGGSGVINSYVASSGSGSMDYGILPNPRIGSFMPDMNDSRHSITKAKITKKDPNYSFMLAVGVDYSSLIVDDSYLTDVSNYEINDNAFSIEPVRIKQANYSHCIKIGLGNGSNMIKGPLTITLKKSKPSWAEDVADFDGRDINADGAMGKTFGFNYIMEGIYEAFTYKNPSYAEFKININ